MFPVTRRSIAIPPCSIADPRNPGSPTGVFFFGLSIHRRRRGGCRPLGRRADRSRRAPRASPPAPPHRGARACAGAIRRGPAGSPCRDRPAAIDAHRAAEAAADFEGGLNHGVAGGAIGSKYLTFRGGVRRIIPYPPRFSAVRAMSVLYGIPTAPYPKARGFNGFRRGKIRTGTRPPVDRHRKGVTFELVHAAKHVGEIDHLEEAHAPAT